MKQCVSENRIFLGIAVVPLLLIAPWDVHAADVARYDYQGAAGICQPALPVHGAALRSRPLGLANEGELEAFVTCTFHGDSTTGGRGAWQIAVNVANDGTTVQTISCTLVDGLASGDVNNATYTTKFIGLFPGQGAFISWVPAEIAGTPVKINRPAVICQLPAQTTLQYLGTYYDENIGN